MVFSLLVGLSLRRLVCVFLRSLYTLNWWRLICVKLCRRQPGLWVSCAEQESYLIVYWYSRAISVHMLCPAWSIVSPCGYRLRSFIWVCGIVLLAARKDCVRVTSVVWAQKRGQHFVFALWNLSRADHPMHEYLLRFVATSNIRASAALGEFGFGDPTLQNWSIQSVISTCSFASVEVAAVGCVQCWYLELF